MTILNAGRDEAMAREEAARDEDFWDELMPRAAELVLTSGQATPQMLQRKMRIRWATIQTLLAELAELGVVGPDQGEPPRRVLLGADALPGVLAAIAGDPEDGVAPVVEGVVVSATLGGEDDEAIEAANLAPPATPVVLTKTSPPPPGEPGGEEDGDSQGGELAIRHDDDLATYQPGELEPWRPAGGGSIGGRVQETWWRVIDHPTTTRTTAVTRQLPKAGVKLAVYTPRGVGRLVAMAGNALFATHTAAMVARIADTDPLGEAWVKASAEHGKVHERLATRRWLAGGLAFLATLVAMAWWAPQAFAGLLAVVVFVGVVAFARGVCRDPKELATCVAVAAGGATVVWFTGPDLASLVPHPPTWFWWILGGGLVSLFGWFGRKDGALVDLPPTMAPHKTPPLTAPMVTAALVALGIPKMREPDDITLLMDVAKDGQGYVIDLELPPAVPATDIIEKREEFAAALRRELGTVWPAVGPRHPGHLSLYVSLVPMVSAVQAPWPVATGGPVSLFQPCPLFTDQRGQWVNQTLAYTAWVIGAVPRMGKTKALLNLGLLAAMDVRSRIYAFDLKGTGDLSSLAKVAHAYRVGDEPEDIADMLRIMRGIRQEMRARTRLVRELTLEENPDRGKVTDTLAGQDPDRFGPIVVLVDEVQVWTQEFSEALPDQVFEGKRPRDPGKEVRDEFIAILRDLVKRGPALGIIPAMATQKPDAKSIPSSIADNASARLCLKVNGQISNDQILGTSSYQAGIRATQFAFSDKGIAFFRGDGAEPLVVRTVVMTAEEADDIAARARALRLAAGRLTGEAADDDIEDAILITDIVDDVEQVMREHGRGTAHHQELVEWLRDLRKDDYEAITVDELSARLRAREVKISQLRIGGVNRKGVRISDLRKRADNDEV